MHCGPDFHRLLFGFILQHSTEKSLHFQSQEPTSKSLSSGTGTSSGRSFAASKKQNWIMSGCFSWFFPPSCRLCRRCFSARSFAPAKLLPTGSTVKFMAKQLPEKKNVWFPDILVFVPATATRLKLFGGVLVCTSLIASTANYRHFICSELITVRFVLADSQLSANFLPAVHCSSSILQWKNNCLKRFKPSKS